MGYEIALELAWDELDRLALPGCTVPLLWENYQVKAEERAVLKPCGAPARDMEAVLILHYLIGLCRHGFHITGEWISFKETDGGKLFWPAFKESTIKPLLQSFQRDPEGMMRNLSSRLCGRIVEGGDASVELAILPEIYVRVVFWKGDEELPPEASMLFDRGLTEIYSTEDVAVLLGALLQRVMN